mmetsp:Transcript_41763/g.68728  ORF Transcript_41763/g.68728 Transcript_41763/m.68728 type:complete len:258 (-) Transcript_41763:2147-2920(-)
MLPIRLCELLIVEVLRHLIRALERRKQRRTDDFTHVRHCIVRTLQQFNQTFRVLLFLRLNNLVEIGDACLRHLQHIHLGSNLVQHASHTLHRLPADVFARHELTPFDARLVGIAQQIVRILLSAIAELDWLTKMHNLMRARHDLVGESKEFLHCANLEVLLYILHRLFIVTTTTDTLRLLLRQLALLVRLIAIRSRRRRRHSDACSGLRRSVHQIKQRGIKLIEFDRQRLKTVQTLADVLQHHTLSATHVVFFGSIR